tara:strand:+ start:45 stop:488 length:444 start_codon:yes stop_codon:yes gene_type:complete
MREITYKVYTFDEHPNKQAVFEWVRDNWHDLGQHNVDEMIDSLKAASEEFGGKLDYAISAVPDRGEFVKITGFSRELLAKARAKAGECPLTGVCWDITVIDGLRDGDLEYQVLKALHAETEYAYSDEGLADTLSVNDYEFTISGECA